MQNGEKINLLTYVKQTHRKGGNEYADFLCDCGKVVNVRVSAVKCNGTKSCGCHRRKVAQMNGRGVATHSLSKHPLYRVWITLKTDYLEQLCDKWKTDFKSFFDWSIDKWNKELSIIRVDNNLPFSESNCYWDKKYKVCIHNRKITNLKKYGFEFAQQSEIVKQRHKEKCIQKYGVSNTSCLESVKQKTRETNLKKYGVIHPSQLLDYRKKAKQRTIDNHQAYCFEGKMSDELAKELGMSRSGMNARIRKYGIDVAVSMEKGQSSIESLIQNLLDEHKIEYQRWFKVEDRIADFFIPSHNIIIEADGLYWHSDAVNPDKYYHRDKKRLYDSKGFTSLFFREDEIENKIDIISSIILNKMNKSNRLYARKCEIGIVSKNEIRKDFLNKNHLMGFGRGKCYVLKYEGKIVCMMQVLYKGEVLSISRFCPALDYSIIGGFTRLLKKAIDDYQPKIISTFIDKRYGSGDYLYSLGFEKINEDVSFVWVRNEKVVQRMTFRSKTGYDYGWYRLYDCGQAHFQKVIS